MITKDTLPEELPPEHWPPWKTLDVPGSKDTIVLVSPDLGPKEGPFRNLERRDAKGRVMWTAELPEGLSGGRSDTYVAIRWEGSRVGANTWSGFYVLIDPDTGKPVASAAFVK